MKNKQRVKKGLDRIYIKNKYQICFNSFWSLWSITHPQIGFCGQTKTKKEAFYYAICG